MTDVSTLFPAELVAQADAFYQKTGGCIHCRSPQSMMYLHPNAPARFDNELDREIREQKDGYTKEIQSEHAILGCFVCGRSFSCTLMDQRFGSEGSTGDCTILAYLGVLPEDAATHAQFLAGDHTHKNEYTDVKDKFVQQRNSQS